MNMSQEELRLLYKHQEDQILAANEKLAATLTYSEMMQELRGASVLQAEVSAWQNFEARR
jgi:hypothetical protein